MMSPTYTLLHSVYLNKLCSHRRQMLVIDSVCLNSKSSVLKMREGQFVFFLLASLELRKWFSWMTRLNSNYFSLQNPHVVLIPFIMSGNGWLRSGSVKPHCFVLSLIAKRAGMGRKYCRRLGENTTEFVSIWRELNCQGFLCFSIHKDKQLLIIPFFVCFFACRF